MARKAQFFQLLNVTNVGRRGRPANPQAHNELRLSVQNAKGQALGTVEFVPNEDGSVSLVYSIGDSKGKTVSFPAVAPKRSRKTAASGTRRRSARRTEATATA